jgi:hypothetical protein
MEWLMVALVAFAIGSSVGTYFERENHKLDKVLNAAAYDDGFHAGMNYMLAPMEAPTPMNPYTGEEIRRG